MAKLTDEQKAARKAKRMANAQARAEAEAKYKKELEDRVNNLSEDSMRKILRTLVSTYDPKDDRYFVAISNELELLDVNFFVGDCCSPDGYYVEPFGKMEEWL